MLKNLIGSLNKEDMFNVLLFAGSATATEVNFKAADVKTSVKEFDKCMEPLFRKMKLAKSDKKGVIKIVVTLVLQK